MSSWKNLIFADAEDSGNKKETPKKETKTFESKFPTDSANAGSEQSPTPVNVVTPPIAVSPTTAACEPHMDKILDMYETGFNNLNMEGYDFFEFYQAILKAGNKPETFSMALTMASTMDSSITKEKLLEQAQYYLDEISKVHQDYDGRGNAKKNEVVSQKENERQTLVNELNDIDAQINELQTLKSQKQQSLYGIDTTYQPRLTDIDCKLMANNEAKNKLVASINSVVSGIKTNL